MFRLGVDVGTSSTVAVLGWPDGRRRPLLFDGAPLLPSAVHAEPDGRLLTGRDALRAGRIDPAALEPNPKRRVGEGSVLLGGTDVPVVDLLAATLRTVWHEALRTAGAPVATVVLTCPATWGPAARATLTAAAATAGMPRPALLAEPVAAATYFATVLGEQVPTGRRLVVYDLGAGTFDVSVVLRHPDGFETRDCDGVAGLGGLDLDAAVVDLALAQIPAEAAELRRQLTAPATAAERACFLDLWDEARQARESLSRQPDATLRLPAAGVTARVTREQFEAAAEPLLRRTVELTAAALQAAGAGPADLAGVFLVGGATRTPLVATLLHQAMGVAPRALEQPELVVAEGALVASAALPAPSPPTDPSGPAPSAARPELPSPVRPLGTSSAHPQGMSLTHPLGTSSVHPQGMSSIRPSGISPAHPSGAPAAAPTGAAARAGRRGLRRAAAVALVAVLVAGAWYLTHQAGDGGARAGHGGGSSIGAATAPTRPVSAGGELTTPATGNGLVGPGRLAGVSPTIVISPTAGRRGTKITVTGSGFTPGGTVEVRFHVDLLGTVVAAADGTFRMEAAIPPQQVWPTANGWTWHVTATDRATLAAAHAEFTGR